MDTPHVINLFSRVIGYQGNFIKADDGIGRIGEVSAVSGDGGANDPLVVFGLQLQQVARFLRQFQKRVGRQLLVVGALHCCAQLPNIQ